VAFLIVEVKGQFSFKVMVLCMENFMAFRHHFLDPSNNVMQVHYMRPSSAFILNLKGPSIKIYWWVTFEWNFYNFSYFYFHECRLWRAVECSLIQDHAIFKTAKTLFKRILSNCNQTYTFSLMFYWAAVIDSIMFECNMGNILQSFKIIDNSKLLTQN